VWTNDSQRILLEHFDAILNSPSHLYYPALPFSPSSSWLHKCYTAEFLQEVKVVKGLQAEWGMCSRTVLLNDSPWTLSYWNNTIAVGSAHKDILILDAITGSQTAILPGHTDEVRSLTFSSDGTSLVSGSYDKTVKLWDMQTGGVVKTFIGHTGRVRSVSISADHTIIASGSEDKTLCLWDIGKGECHHIIEHKNAVYCTRFSSTDPQCLISVSGTTAQHWDINNYKVRATYGGCQIAFSSNGTQFISRTTHDVTVQNIDSGVAVAKFDMANSYFNPCCFSPDGRLVAVAAGCNACVWDITSPDPHLVETFVGHTKNITSLTFSSPSTLISASQDKSVKFWQIGALSADPVATDQKSTSLTSPPTKSIALEAKHGIIIPSDLPDRVIKTWGISAGLCKGSLHISAEDFHQSGIHLVDSKLIFVWYTDNQINVWDAEKGELLHTIRVPRGSVIDLRVSGDGSKVFCLYGRSIQAWDIWTREAVGEVELWDDATEILAIDSSKVWVNFESITTQGWDFGISGKSPVRLPNKLPDWLHLNDTKLWETKMSRMKDIVTEKVVFQLPGRFGNPAYVQWGGQYLLACFRSGEVLVLDFSHKFL